jgi:hypothetical protein
MPLFLCADSFVVFIILSSSVVLIVVDNATFSRKGSRETLRACALAACHKVVHNYEKERIGEH